MNEKALKTVAELLEVLRRNGYEANSSYVFENFFADYGTSEVISHVLCGDGEEVDYEEYYAIPIEDRLAKFHKLSEETT